MTHFIDTKGRKWTLDVTVAAIKRVRSLAGVDLLAILDKGEIPSILLDPIRLVDVLFALVKPQADSLNISDEQFGEAMAGDCIAAAGEAFVEGLVRFSPNPSDRAVLARVHELTRAAMDRARAVVTARLESGVVERAMNEEIDRAIHGMASGNAPGSSASTLGP